MTQEEKAKAYDEALEDMRVIYPNLKCDAKLAVEHAFPQLRESEDERMRKLIIDRVRSATEMTEGLRELLLSYLEKQKYDRMKPIYDARESFESALEKAWNDYHNGYENVDKLEDDYVECAHAKGFREGYLFGLEKQKEQNPKEPGYKHEDYFCERCQANAFNAGRESVLKEQKPAWSEEDEKKRKLLIWQVYRNIEDETNDLAQSVYDGIKGHDPDLEESIEDWKKCLAWLKSLRPQPHWKPSEEQMMKEAVKWLVDDDYNHQTDKGRFILGSVGIGYNGYYIPYSDLLKLPKEDEQ